MMMRVEAAWRNSRIGPALRTLAGALLLLAGFSPLPARTVNREAASLTALIRRQTEEFSRAGKVGDRATLSKLMDPDIVFTNEDGTMPSRSDIIDSAAPAAGDFSLVVTDFRLRQQGDVATATFVDVLTEEFHGLHLRTNFHSTEVWARRGNQWKMIACQTMIVPHDGPTISLSTDQLDDYPGTYRLGSDVNVVISREGSALSTSTNGAAPRPLLAEYRDVLFVAGAPSGRRYFQRDSSGRVVGYVVNLNGNDLLLQKVG